MKRLLLLALTLPCFGVTLITLNTTSAATTSLVNFPLGSYQYAGRFSGLPSTIPGSEIPLFVIPTDGSGHKISCSVPNSTLNSTVNLTCYNTNDNSVSGGLVTLPLPTGTTAIRFVMTQQKDATYGQIRVDVWGDDCSEIGSPTINRHLWGVEPSLDLGGEPSTTSQTFSIGGNNLGVAFFRASGYPAAGIGADPVCPSDVLATPAPNMDFRFEGNSRTDVSGNGYVLSSSGNTFANSTTYNPAVFITGNWTAPRPVIAQVPVNLTCNVILSDGNVNAATYTWSNQSASLVPAKVGYTAVTGSFSATNTATTTFTPTSSGSFWPRCAVTDAVPRSGQQDFNIGVVNSNTSGVKIQSNAELGKIIGPIPRFGTSAWPWYTATYAASAEALSPYYYPPPMPNTTTGSISSASYIYFSARGPFTGLVTDVYQAKMVSTTTYQWQKNGGGYSASLPLQKGASGQTGCPGTPVVMPVTDGVIICWDGTTPTVNDVFTLMAPQAGTATITGAAPNHIDSATGYVCGGLVNCFSASIVVVGTGTHWMTGTSSQVINAGGLYWFEWDYLGDGSNQGRFYLQVQSVIDDTHLTINGNGGIWPVPVSKSSGMTLQSVSSSNGDFAIYYGIPAGFNVGSSLDYYDSGKGIVSLSDSTNLDVYTNEAYAWCNNWWQYASDHGYNTPPPRNSGWHTLMACASKFGFTDWWGVQPASTVPGTGLAYALTYPNDSLNPKYNPTSPVSRDNIFSGDDIREAAFATQAYGLFAQVYPAHTSDPSAQANWCTYVAHIVSNLWLNPWVGNGGLYTEIGGAYDYWQDNLVGSGTRIQFPGIGTPVGNYMPSVYGNSPWRDQGLATIANTNLYNALSSPGCNNTGLAPSVQTLVKRAADYIYTYGRSPDDGLYYNANYVTNSEPGFGNVIQNFQSKYGDVGENITVSGITTGTTITAAPGALDIAFQARFGPCNGTTSITLRGTNYQVDSCPDNYTLTLHTAAPSGNYGKNDWANPATIAVMNGSATVTGSNSGSTQTGFQELFAPCNGTTYIVIVGATGADNGVYQVTACGSETSLTISPVWSGANQTTQQDFSRTTLASTNCAPSIGSCEPDFFNGKNLAHDWVVSLGQKYSWTGDPTDKSHLEKGLASLYGGPALGPAFIGPNVGPQTNSLLPANFDGVLPICGTTAQTVQPCTQSTGGSGFLPGIGLLAKPFGESAGAGNSDNAQAFYLTPGGASTGGLTTSGGVHYSGGIVTH